MQFFKVAERMARATLPAPLFASLRRTERGVRALTWRMVHPGSEHSCPFCGKQFGKFIPFVNRYGITVTADIISGQSNGTERCPCCRALDRERALYFYFKENISLASKRVLHVAPEDGLHFFIASSGCLEYVCGDLNPRHYHAVSSKIRKIDLLHVDYPDRHFDIAICNHVLEHIPDDLTAMKEIYRILKPSGIAILLVPIGAKLGRTFEDASKVTAAERAQAFGKSDHVRIYAECDYLDRLRSVGFRATVETPNLGEGDRFRYGINNREKIYVAIRPA
jgi:SAM-dependent methyltransferase